MAQKVVGYIKLQIPAGKATPAPPVGPALGQHGVNIMAFTKEFNERTKNDVGLIIPGVITVYADRTFSFITKTPPAALSTRLRTGLRFYIVAFIDYSRGFTSFSASSTVTSLPIIETVTRVSCFSVSIASTTPTKPSR